MGTLKWLGDKFQKLVEDQIDSHMRGLGNGMVEDARSYVPVDTGQLRDSIGYTYNTKTKRLNLYADMPYALFVEYGTSLTAAQPFLRPALQNAGFYWKRGITAQLPSRTKKQYTYSQAQLKSTASGKKRVDRLPGLPGGRTRPKGKG